MAEARDSPETFGRLARQLFAGEVLRDEALAALRARGRPEVAPALIQALRFVHDDGGAIVATLEALTGARPGATWHDWMLWQ